ncbi:uncharacterized protein METZ01_LOCUS57661, partial [marine metagenome]
VDFAGTTKKRFQSGALDTSRSRNWNWAVVGHDSLKTLGNKAST